MVLPGFPECHSRKRGFLSQVFTLARSCNGKNHRFTEHETLVPAWAYRTSEHIGENLHGLTEHQKTLALVCMGLQNTRRSSSEPAARTMLMVPLEMMGLVLQQAKVARSGWRHWYGARAVRTASPRSATPKSSCYRKKTREGSRM